MNVFWRGSVLLLFVPALIWGYGKTVFRLAQITDDSSIDGKLNATKRAKGTGDKKREEPLEVPVSNPIQSSVSSDSEVVTKSGLTNGTVSPADSGDVEPDRASTSTKIEPDPSDGTYNQVRVKKPSIPSRFDGSGSTIGPQATSQNQNPISFLGLLGVPTLVFSVLFFVMWGVISGKIQRIMF